MAVTIWNEGVLYVSQIIDQHGNQGLAGWSRAGLWAPSNWMTARTNDPRRLAGMHWSTRFSGRREYLFFAYGPQEPMNCPHSRKNSQER